MPGYSGEPRGDYLVCFFILHMRLRVHRAPGIPHALTYSGGKFIHHSGVEAPRDRGGVCASLPEIEAMPVVPDKRATASANPGPPRERLRSSRHQEACVAELAPQRAQQFTIVVMGARFRGYDVEKRRCSRASARRR
jgi:hypothetical protein